ncbi:MAG: CoA transferase [Paracoccaceae bacterium]
MTLQTNVQCPDESPAAQSACGGVLSGIRVLDLTRVVAGPLAAQTLADLGADVVKVERVGDGDDLRTLGPPWIEGRPGSPEQSTYFQMVNRNKRSISLDFSSAEGAEILRRLATESDVFIENFRTGTLAKYGLGYEDLRAINPRLIYCSITGFGQTGPYHDRSGYDYLVQAMGGQMAVTGQPEADGGIPTRVGVPIADITAGNNAAIAILAALLHRDRSGQGQHIDVALFDSQVALLMNNIGSWLNARAPLPRTGNEHPTAVPNGVFECADGFILIATFNDREFARLATALGRPQWAEDPRFVRSRDRLENRAALTAEINKVLSTNLRAHWMEKILAAKVSCGPINEMPDIEDDPQLQARGMFVTLEHPVTGTVRLVASPLRLSETPVTYRAAPPLAGEHSEEVLRQYLSLSAEELDRLRAQSII